jgi:hypothetical protein
LKDKSHAAVTQQGLTIPLERKKLFPLELDASLPGMLKAGKDVEKCRFARPGSTPQEDHLSPGHIQVDTLENLQLCFSKIVGLAKASGT